MIDPETLNIIRAIGEVEAGFMEAVSQRQVELSDKETLARVERNLKLIIASSHIDEEARSVARGALLEVFEIRYNSAHN